MQSKLVRVDIETHILLHRMAREMVKPIAHIVEVAVSEYYKADFWKRTNEGVAAERDKRAEC